MEDKPKIDLKQHVSKRVSRLYMLKIFLYILLLTGIIVYYFNQSEKKTAKKETKDVREIKNITIEQ